MHIPSGLTEKTRQYIALLLEVLRRVGVLHIRGLAKYMSEATGRKVDPKTVSRIVYGYLRYFVDVERVEQIGSVVKAIRLKPGKENTTLDDVLKYLEVQRKIRSPK
ncbi:MAG TPA: hypothetical protein VJH90_01085 [archaeon]|nr:hypothetical protein [archaeon]